MFRESNTQPEVTILCLCGGLLLLSSHPVMSEGLPVLHHLPEFAQVRAHCIGDAIQPSHSLIPSSPSAFNLSQHQGLFQ